MANEVISSQFRKMEKEGRSEQGKKIPYKYLQGWCCEASPFVPQSQSAGLAGQRWGMRLKPRISRHVDPRGPSPTLSSQVLAPPYLGRNWGVSARCSRKWEAGSVPPGRPLRRPEGSSLEKWGALEVLVCRPLHGRPPAGSPEGSPPAEKLQQWLGLQADFGG